MCGIAGFFDRAPHDDAALLERRGRAMADAIAYRGPDGSGIWCDEEAGLALAHRRLAVVDLTPTGFQPMVSADERWVLCYNGEVYNAQAIARLPELASVAFRGTSDTEVILESIAHRGLDRTIDDLNGMFAFALWDRKTRTLHLVRDRLGIKPLYLAETERGIAFGSELKAIAADVRDLAVNPHSVASFLRFGFVPAPYSIFHNVSKLMPGEVVRISANGATSRRRYWSLRDTALKGLSAPFRGSDEDAEEQLNALLADAVAGQMIADVPLGAFLSGGIDSSTVVALMVAAGRGRVRTFSIGFPDLGFDESVYARAVAKHIGTEHHDMMLTGDDALKIVPQLPEMYDEPFADSSQIPTYLISQMTRRSVTVALSGDGGDELFAGYNRYNLGHGLTGVVARSPRAMRRVAGAALNAMPDRLIEMVAALAPSRSRPHMLVDKIRKMASVLPLNRLDAYRWLVSQNADPSALMFGVAEHPVVMKGLPSDGSDRFIEHMQLFDTLIYMPDDILHKVDRASMAVSLEVRPPLLDHRVVEFAWHLPRHMRVRDGETKWLLRKVLDRYVPRHLVERPKMGFGIPLATWLRGPLRAWAEDLLDPARLGDGLLDVVAIRKLWEEHIGGRRNWAYALWTIMMYEAWRRRWA